MGKDKQKKDVIAGSERRYLTHPVKHETRMDDDVEQHIIEGYAAMFNQRADLGWFDEEILPGAFDDVLNDDVRALINHDPTLILARSINGKGTLSLRLDDKGLIYSYATPDRSYARDLQDAIESGDVSQSSFSFSIEEEVWTYADDKGKNDLRQIKKFRNLFDVSPVTFPAYTDTSVAKRSYDKIEKPTPDNKSFDEYEARHRMLNLKKA